jgi:hypothetical protein
MNMQRFCSSRDESARVGVRRGLDVLGIGCTAGSEHHTRIPFEPRQLRALHWRLAERGAELLVRHREQIFSQRLRILPAITSRATNALSVASIENFAFHGHTSWEKCRYIHFAIPLSTGRQTLRAATTCLRGHAEAR